MADLQSYQRALQQAKANNDAEAIAYFESKIAELGSQQPQEPQQPQVQPQTQPQERASEVAIRGMQDSFERTYGIRPPATMVAGWVSTGKGFADAWRGIKGIFGFDEEINEADQRAFQQLQEDYPVVSTIGELAGQSAPFLVGGPAAGATRLGAKKVLQTLGATEKAARLAQPAGKVSRTIGATGIGGLEGAAITKGQGGDAADTAAGAGVGGFIGGASEMVLPSIARVFGKIGRKLVFNNGKVSPEILDELRRNNIDPEQMMPTLRNIYENYGDNVSAEDVVRLGLFEKYGVPATKGDVQGDFAQQAFEARLVESSTDEFADPMRATRLKQSEALKGILDQQIKELGVPERAGETLKSALSGRKTMLRQQKNQLYKQLAEEASSVGNIPLMIASPADEALKRRIARLSPSQVKALDETLLEFGIGPQKALEQFAEQGNTITPLNITNAEELRQALNLIERSDQSGAITNITGPLKQSLDEELELAIDYLEQQGRQTDIGDIAKAARATTRELKTEFDPQATVGRLVATKRNGVEPVVEASNALREIFTTGTVSKKEKLERVLTALRKQGDKGKVAIGDMQSAAIQRLIDDAWNAPSRTINGERVIGGTAFQRSMDKFGDENLELLFQDNPQALKKLRDVRKMVDNITPPAGAIPKGSASTQLDILNFLSRQMMGSKIPGLNIVLEGAAGLAQKSAKRKAAMEAGKAVPKWTQRELSRAKQIAETMPNLAAALGIAAIVDENNTEEKDNEPLQ